MALRGRAALAASVALALLGQACAPARGEAYEKEMARADAEEVSGRYAAAAESYDRAAGLARVPRDGAHARYLAALMAERAGDLGAARDRFEAIARANPPLEDSAAAAYKEAAMDVDHADEARGWEEMDAALARFPNDGMAKPALHRLLAHKDETLGPAATLAYLDAHAPAFEGTERAEEIAYERAKRLETLGRLADARDAFVRTAARWRYPVGALWDDALYHAALLDRRLGRPREALADLVAMLSQRETSVLNGSYVRPRFPEAQMLAGILCRDDLHDAAQARKFFHDAYAKFPDWGMRDQALWFEAEIDAKSGDAADQCAALSTLAREFPDSRYVPCAIERCPKIERPAGSRAPARCHDYIESGRAGDAQGGADGG